MIRPVLKLGLLAAAAFTTAWLSISLGIAGVTREPAPELALKWWRGDARAMQRLAEQSIASTDGQRRGQANAQALALEAVRRDVLLPDAYATLAVTRITNPRAAAAAMAYSESLSRRNLPTQLWLIEAAVSRSDIREALRHYDIALRTSEQAPAMLFPILGQAMDQPAILAELARVLARYPLWRNDFLLYAIRSGPHPASVANLSELSVRLGAPFGKNLDGLLISRLAEGGEISRAIRVYRHIAIAGQADLPLRDGNFEREGDQTVFDWLLFDNADFWGRRNGGEGQGSVRLEFGANSGGSGVVARQLLVLRPGHYVIRWESGNIEEGQRLAPAIVIRCGQAPNRLLLRQLVPMPVAAKAQTSVPFSVPPESCLSQRLDLELSGDQDLPQGSGWIDSISISAGGG